MRRGRSFHRQRSASFFDFGTSDCYQFFLAYGPGLQALATNAHNSLLDQNIEHDTFDRYWQDGDIAKHLHNIHCAVLNVGGSFDAEDLAGTFRTYHAIRKENPALTNMLVIGPWGHGDWLRSAGRKLGPLDFESDTGTWFRNQVLFSFFEHYLKNAPMPDLTGVTAFETGANQWRRYPSWPPPGAHPKSLYLHANGKLSFDPPSAQEAAYDEYVSDPASPVPYVEHPRTNLDETYMYGDQRFAAARPDVLTYRTEPLSEDLTVAGPLAVLLQVSSSGSDSEFVVKLIDEGDSPTTGFQQLIRGEPMRARFRNPFSSRKPWSRIR